MDPVPGTSAIAVTIARVQARRIERYAITRSKWHPCAWYAKLCVTGPVQQGDSMPAARRSASKPSARSGQGVRARAAARSSATRREVEQSIARFEKRLDEANDALKTLGGHLGTGARGSYKEVTAALVALRRNAAKTNKQALKDFDKLRSALTKANSSSGSAPHHQGELAVRRRAAPSRSTRFAFDRVALELLAFDVLALDGQPLAREEELVTLQRGAGVDSHRLRRLELHRAAHAHPATERHVAVHDQPLRLAQRRRALGEAPLEVVEQLVELGVELDVGKVAPRARARARRPSPPTACTRRSGARAGRRSS